MAFICIVPNEYGGDMDLEMAPLMKEKFPETEKLLLNELSRLNITSLRV